MNVVHTGTSSAPARRRAGPQHPGYPRSVANAFYLTYGLMDTSLLSYHVIHLLALVGGVLASSLGVWWLRRGRRSRAASEAAGTALPFLAPLLVIGGAAVVAWGARQWGFPIRGLEGCSSRWRRPQQTYARISNEDYSAFGPVGIVALLAAAVLAVRAYVRADVPTCANSLSHRPCRSSSC